MKTYYIVETKISAGDDWKSCCWNGGELGVDDEDDEIEKFKSLAKAKQSIIATKNYEKDHPRDTYHRYHISKVTEEIIK